MSSPKSIDEYELLAQKIDPAQLPLKTYARQLHAYDKMGQMDERIVNVEDGLKTVKGEQTIMKRAIGSIGRRIRLQGGKNNNTRKAKTLRRNNNGSGGSLGRIVLYSIAAFFLALFTYISSTR